MEDGARATAANRSQPAEAAKLEELEMRKTSAILATLIGFGLSLGTIDEAAARDARGATITNTNHPDPTAQQHKHVFVHRSRRTFPNEPQCCGSVPRIHTSTCTRCGYEVEQGTREAPNGSLEVFRTSRYPRR